MFLLFSFLSVLFGSVLHLFPPEMYNFVVMRRKKAENTKCRSLFSYVKLQYSHTQICQSRIECCYFCPVPIKLLILPAEVFFNVQKMKRILSDTNVPETDLQVVFFETIGKVKK